MQYALCLSFIGFNYLIATINIEMRFHLADTECCDNLVTLFTSGSVFALDLTINLSFHSCMRFIKTIQKIYVTAVDVKKYQ